MKDFFLSYNRFDKSWAEWIAWILEDANYSVVIQAWDFRPGGNFILDMQRAASETSKTIAVLSETYLNSAYTQPEWTAAFAQDPAALKRKLIPVRIKKCEPQGILASIVYVDLVDTSETQAKQKLLDMLPDRLKPSQPPPFPGDSSLEILDKSQNVLRTSAPFPNKLATSPATNRVAAMKIRRLEQQFQSLEEDYNAAFDQLQYMNNTVGRSRLGRQIQSIEQQLTEVAENLDELAK